MTKAGRLFYEFGPFRVERRERLLRRGEEVIALPPKAAALLVVLAERRGEAVDKDELLRLVWPGTFVEEGSLAQNVSLLRKVLHDSQGSPYIETVPRRGYRFVAPVRNVQEEGTGARSLAVLPLVNLSGDRSQDFFAEGMTEELIGCLMKIKALRVASRTSVMAYKDVSRPLREIARELDVQWIVEGAVRQSGGRVRVTAHLIDGATESQLWADEYEKDLRDVLALQSEVAHEIARQVRVTVTPQGTWRPRAVDPDSYDAFLRGRHVLNRRTRDDLRRAVDYFRTAINRDPTYAPAYAGLADAYALIGTIGYDVLPPREAMPLARAAASRALEIDETMAQAHASLGYVQLSYEWDWAGAEHHFKQAIAHDPAYPTAHQWYGHCLFAMHRLDEAAQEMRLALEADPLSVPCNLAVGWSHYYSRQYDDAIAQYHRTLELAPHLPMVHYELGLTYLNKGCHEDACAAFEKGYELSGGEAASLMLLAHAYALMGRSIEANRHLAALQQMATRVYVPALYIAFACVGLRNRDEVFAWFDKAYEERSNYLIYLGVEPSLDVLRTDPRFVDLMRRVGLAFVV
jgi:TolB-like protein/Tfp pilus assembly protein PilF